MKELNLIEEGSEKSTAEMEMNNSNLPDLYDLKTIEDFQKLIDDNNIVRPIDFRKRFPTYYYRLVKYKFTDSVTYKIKPIRNIDKNKFSTLSDFQKIIDENNLSKKEFKKNFSGLYKLASQNKFLKDLIFKINIEENNNSNKYNSLTVESINIFLIENSVINMTDLKKRFNGLYRYVRKTYDNDTIKNFKFKNGYKECNVSYDLDYFQEFIKNNKIKSLFELEKKHPVIYKNLISTKLIDQLIFEPNGEDPFINVDKNNYNTIKDFQRYIDENKLFKPIDFKTYNPTIYRRACELGFNNTNLIYKSDPKNYNIIEDFQNLINSEDCIKSPTDLRKNFPGIYKKATKLKIADKLEYSNRHYSIDYSIFGEFNTAKDFQNFIDNNGIISITDLNNRYQGIYNRLISSGFRNSVVFKYMRNSKSLLQDTLENLLDSLGIHYEPEKTFNWLVSDKGGKFRLDIFIPSVNISIEGNGIQHYEFVEYFHKTEDKFIERINNDKIKYNLCLDHGINILYFTDISRFTNKKGLINNYFTEVITDLDTLREKILSYYN